MQVFEKLAEYRYEQLALCHDKSTGLRAVIAIHDTTLGPALGGCRIVSLCDGGRSVSRRATSGEGHDLQGRRERP